MAKRRFLRKVLAGFGLLTALMLVVGACGGGGSEPAATTAPTTAPQATQVPPTRAPAVTGTARPTTAPVATSTPARVASGQLVVAYSTVGDTLDPIRVTAQATSNYGLAIFDGGVWRNKAGSPIPGIFTKWDLSTDGLSWTVSIRDGMKYHNGETITADDSLFALQRLMTPQSTSSAAVRWRTLLESLTAPDAKTLVLKTKSPYVTGFSAIPAGTPRSPFVNSPDGKAFDANPIGSGPFKVASVTPGQKIRMEATGVPHLFRQMPDFKTVEFVLIPEESTRAAMLKTGAADFFDASPDGAAPLEASGFKILELPSLQQVMLNMWGLDNPEGLKGMPTADIRVRQALEMAINRDEIIKTLLRGRGFASARPYIYEGVEGFDPAWQGVKYDPSAAKKLLAETGYASGLKVKFFNTPIPNAVWTLSAAEAIAGYWKAVGVTTEIIPVEYNTWRTMYRENPRKQILGAYGWTFNFKNYEGLEFMATSYVTGTALHTLSDPAMDALITKARGSLNPTDRVQVIRQIVEKVHELHFSLPLAEVAALYPVSSKIASWDPIRYSGPGLSWETVVRK